MAYQQLHDKKQKLIMDTNFAYEAVLSWRILSFSGFNRDHVMLY